LFSRAATCAALLWALLAPAVASSQSLGSLLTGAKPASNTPTPSDPLKRETPRSSIHYLLEACHGNRFSAAAQYLDLQSVAASQRPTQGAELARALCVLLNRNPRFEVNDLSNAPEGDTEDGLAPGFDSLATFDVNGEAVTLQLERVNQQGIQVWLVSASSVARIRELSSRITPNSAIESRLPELLVKVMFIGTPLWVWIAMALLALLLALLSEWLSAIFLAAAKVLAKRYAKSFDAAHRFHMFSGPLRLILSVLVFRAAMEFLAPSALLREYLLKLMALLFVFGSAALVTRILDVVSDHVISRMNPRERALSYSVVPLGLRIVKICIFILAALITLSEWGYNTNAILAGLGVGGLALALAAQKTIENLFGGFSLISDRAVLVGDVCQFGGQTGTVEDIGLRSTRIRTPDRTLVTVPNSQFSTMTLENFSKREKMWFHPSLQLRPETSPAQVREMMEAVTKLLEEHPMVDASGVPLRFTKITPQSLQLDIFAYVLTLDYNQFLIVQSELLLKIMDIAAEREIGFAVPFAESITIPWDVAMATREHPPVALPGGTGDGSGVSAGRNNS